MNVFKFKTRSGKPSNLWHGKVRVGKGTYDRVTLFADKATSRAKLRELQVDADKRSAGQMTPDVELLARPIAELAKLYIDRLRLERKDADHIRISEWMLNKLISAGGWRFFRDITVDSMVGILAELGAKGKTASYQNKFIMRAKAFVNWILPDGWPNPLRKLKRIKEKGAAKTRERRAAEQKEIVALFKREMPAGRKLSYALAAFNGLRRNEVARLTWGDLELDAAIPFVRLRRKQGATDDPDSVPLHPYVLSLLKSPRIRCNWLGVQWHDGLVVEAVPDVATLESDWLGAGVPLIDAKGRRLDFHALRHTFQTFLDVNGCSRATKKKLMRHAGEDVTDGYAHAELAEMLAALKRIPSPDAHTTEHTTDFVLGTA